MQEKGRKGEEGEEGDSDFFLRGEGRAGGGADTPFPPAYPLFFLHSSFCSLPLLPPPPPPCTRRCQLPTLYISSMFTNSAPLMSSESSADGCAADCWLRAAEGGMGSFFLRACMEVEERRRAAWKASSLGPARRGRGQKGQQASLPFLISSNNLATPVSYGISPLAPSSPPLSPRAAWPAPAAWPPPPHGPARPPTPPAPALGPSAAPQRHLTARRRRPAAGAEPPARCARRTVGYA